MIDTREENQTRGPVAWMAGNSVAANLVMLLCLVGGLLALLNIKQEVFPDFTVDVVQVRVEYPGASPEEIEEGVVLPVEEAVEGLEGIDEVRSTASENWGTVSIEAVRGADLRQLVDDVQSEVDRITTFPDETEEPDVEAVARRREVLELLLYGDVDPKVLHRLGENVRDTLLQHQDITLVEISGFPGLEISVEISQETLRRYGMTLGDIARRIRDRAVDLPGGDIDTESGEVLLRMKERRDWGQEFAQLPILNTENGSQVMLEDIGSVEDGFEEADRYSTYNGKRSVELEVYRVGEQTPIEVHDAVVEQMDTLDLPAGVQYTIQDDRSEIYQQRAELMLKNGALGLVLVLCLLGLFLEARLAFWVMMGIPISFLGSFLLLPWMGISINMISMFAYIVALGIVVDDAIVVGENVYSYQQQGMPFLQAAIKGAREVAMPVTFSVLTNIIAFLPILFIPGVTGKIFGVIPVVVCSAFAISLIECLFVLPAHLGHGKNRRRTWISAKFHEWQQSFSYAFKRWVRTYYGPFLNFILRNRYLAFTTASAVLILVLGYALSGRMGMGLFPSTESDFAEAEVEFPYGTPVEKTESATDTLVSAIKGVVGPGTREKLVEGVVVDIGRGGSHHGRVRVMLADPEIREEIMPTAEFARRWREETGEILGAEYVKFESAGGGPGSRDDINVELRHRNMDVLRKASEDLAQKLREYPIVRDVNDGFQPGKPQFDLKMKPEGKALGLTAQMVGRQVRDAFYGARAIRQLRGRNEVDVRVKLPESQRDSVYHLEEFMVRTPAGRFVLLREVADAKLGRAYVTIDRRDGSRVVQVTGDAQPSSRAGEVLGDLKKTALVELQDKYPGLSYSFEGVRASIRENMSSLQVSFVLAMLGIYAMLAIPFRSYVQPLIVMLSIPFGIVGAVIGHLLMGYSLSVISLFGVVALAGVVVNDSLVLVTFANRARKNPDVDRWDAIQNAAIQRFRPVVLTSFTTFGGLAPLIFETSRQARMMIPMAISLGFGILFALAITLCIVPTLYLTVEDAKTFLLGLTQPEVGDTQSGRQPSPAEAD